MSDHRSRKRRQLVTMGAFAVLAVVLPVTAHALVVVPTFPDVPESHPFFEEIEWMADTGVTTGFPDGTFKPGQPVTRQSMSAFMQRVYDLQDDMSWNQNGTIFDSVSDSTWTDLPGAVAIVSVPDGVYANIAARFTAESLCTGVASDWCSVRIVMSETGSGGPFTELYPIVGTDFAFDYAGPSGTWSSQAFERFQFGDPGGTYYLKVQAQRHDATDFAIDDWSFVAETDLQPSDYVPS